MDTTDITDSDVISIIDSIINSIIDSNVDSNAKEMNIIDSDEYNRNIGNDDDIDHYNVSDDESNIYESSANASDDDDDDDDEEDNDDDPNYASVDNDMMLFFKSIEENEKSNESNIDDSSNDKFDNGNDFSFNNDDACQERHYFTTQRDNLYKILVPSIDKSSDCLSCKNRRPFPEFITISSPHNALDIVTDPPSLDEYINEPRYPVSRHSQKNLSFVDKIVSLWPEDHVHSLPLDACDEQNDNTPILYEDPYEYERYREEFKDSKEQPPDRNDKIVESMRAQDSYDRGRNPDNDLCLCVLQTFHICLCFLSMVVAVVELYLMKNSKEMVNSKSLGLIFTNDAASKVLAYYIILISMVDALFLCRELRLKIGLQTKMQVSASFLNSLTFVQDFLRRNSLYYRFFLMILLLGVGGSIGPLLSTVVGCSSAVIYLFDD